MYVQGLGELKEDVRRKDQELKQSRKAAMQLEFQRKSLHANLRDAEDALRTAAKSVSPFFITFLFCSCYYTDAFFSR